ncbi:antitoxin Xre/MbcA/ParS-like domain-containing protein [Mesorhizobium sp. LjRoot246]|uniref:antitoxin Xre/MbcA/ParS-like domain-containing protein n=1 Tax=Mesorhizobium sp. LjRoot246 TaxID=3342294 RepID=UPI003ECE93E3
MNKSLEVGNEARQDELSSLISKEVQRVLAQYDEVVEAHISISSRVGNTNIAAADLPSSTRQQAIHDDLAALASGFVHRLAVEAARRFDASLREETPLTCQSEDGPKCAVLKSQDHQPDCMRIENWAGQVAGPTYLEEHYGIPRSTLHWWQRHNDVIALRKGARKHVFPLAQFVDGRPAPGIRQVVSLIANPRLAWLWLIRPSPLLDGRVPIEMLRQDLAEEVVSAARDFAST